MPIQSLISRPLCLALIGVLSASGAVAQVNDTYFGTVKASALEGLSYGARGCIVEISDSAKSARMAQKGEVLVRLDDQRSQLALRTAEARVLELQASVDERQLDIEASRANDQRLVEELDFVSKEYQRNSVMLGRGLINETTMESVERGFMSARFASERAKEAIANAEAAKKRAQIALEIGQLELRSAGINHDMLVLTAPIDGALIDFDANVGDCVQEGELAAQMYAPDEKAIEIYFLISRLSAEQKKDVSVGAPVTFTRINGETCGGVISRLDTQADLETQFVEATVDVQPDCAPGLFLNEAVEVRPASASN